MPKIWLEKLRKKLVIGAERAATNGIKSRLMKCRPNCTGYMQNGCARVSLCVQTVRVYVSIMTTGASAWPRYLYEKTVPNKAFLSFFVFYVYQSLMWCKFCDNQCIFKLPHTTIPPFNQLVLNTFLFSFFFHKRANSVLHNLPFLSPLYCCDGTHDVISYCIV